MPVHITKKDLPLLCVGLLGLALAVLSGLAENVDFLRSWCAAFSDGCRVTETFTMLRVQVWIWGAVFYATLIWSVLFAPRWLAWLIPAALGAEVALAGIMVLLGATCVFCLGNAAVVLLLALMHIRRDMLWQALALALLGFVLSGALLAAENRLLPWYCSRYVPRPAADKRPVPSQPVEIPLGGSQSMGPATASVTVFEFSDFRCPACRRMHKVVKEAMKAYGGQVRWVFKNFPLRSHKDAQIVSEGALCASRQNMFWEFHDVLFNTEEEYTPERLTKIAQDLWIDPAAFRECLDSHAAKAQVEKEMQSGVEAGIDGVPSFVINGNVVVGGRPLEQFKALIDAELARKGAGK